MDARQFLLGHLSNFEGATRFCHTSACDHVHTKLQEESLMYSKEKDIIAIVSFSFVNTDMRDIFCQRFPNALWALLDTTASEADERIQTREGHF
mmetsp:Transcript_21240/g.38569  ORF Transcript_21240/g.38569 Transcript_21240/m.38569 type:complete len:94 (+) Transcript_21240:186-467(+)